MGAGASGIAAAKWYQDRFGPDSKILLIDSLPDFGGHSHRNEFHIPDASNGGADVMLLRNGGTVNLDSIGAWNQPQGGQLDIPGSYGQPAVDMLAFCGVDPDNFPSSSRAGHPELLRPAPDAAVPEARTGAQDSVVRAKQGSQTWPEFLATTPYSPEAQAGIATIMTDDSTDWISIKDGPKTDQEKKAILAQISYKKYLMDYVGVNEEATGYLQRTSHGLFAAGIQCTQAGDSWALGNPGFDGLGLNGDIFPGIGRTAQQDSMPNSDPTRAWPDGNTSLLRLLVSKLIPNAIGDVAGARPEPGQHPGRAGRLHAARPQVERRPDPAQQHRRRRPARPREVQARPPRQVAEGGARHDHLRHRRRLEAARRARPRAATS